jgi:hypothetical protein
MRDDSGRIGRITWASATGAADPGTPAAWRRPAAIAIGTAGVALYNWWVIVALHTHLMTTPDELFSDLEAAGRPDASLLQHLDLAAGLVLIAALLLRGRRGPDGPRAEWPWLVAFAAAGAVGGHFAYVCPEGISASCRSAEWRLALPPHHYVHVLAGIVEFATATVAVYLAWQRTRPVERPTTRVIRWTGRALVGAYPLLGLAYLTDRMGAFVEPIFFVCFSVMAFVELAESDRGGAVGTASVAGAEGHRPGVRADRRALGWLSDPAASPGPRPVTPPERRRGADSVPGG